MHFRIYDDDEIRELVNKLNAVTGIWAQWKWTRARKDHTDLFGEPIEEGEQYLNRVTGPGWGEDVKMSVSSMGRLLFAIFENNPVLRDVADKLAEARLQQISDDHQRFSPGDRLSLKKNPGDHVA